MVAQAAETGKRIKSRAKNWSDRISLLGNPAYRPLLTRIEGSICTSGFGIPHSNHADFNTYAAMEECLNSFDTSGMWEDI